MVDKFRMAFKGFIERNGELLLLKESAKYEEGTNAGKWQIPGGRLEPGEHYSEALKREIREETDLEIKIDKPFSVGEWRPKINGEKLQIVAVFFRCKALKGDVKLSKEHSEYSWINPENYEDYDLIGNLPKKIREYSKALNRSEELPKLVRDKIPELIRENGQKPETRKVSDSEADGWLRKKVVEEAEEFEEDGDIEELADLFAVMMEYMERKNIDISMLQSLEEDKSSDRGGFKQNIVLDDINE